MKTIKLLLILVFTLISCFSFSQRFAIEFQQCYGGSKGDSGREIIRLADSTYIILGGTRSEDGDISFLHGESDIWLVKTDWFGNLLWEKTIGGSDIDFFLNFYLTPEGNYIISSETFSNDGDVSGNHGGMDYWVAKTDSLGNIVWQRCLGSSVNDYPGQMSVDGMGNIYVIGGSHGDDGDITDPHGLTDFWIVKLSLDGDLLWEKSLGGSGYDWGFCISPTADGGYIAGGYTESTDGDVQCELHSPNQRDIWIVKIDSLNNIQWQQCYGGSYGETAVDIKVTDDGGYIIAGITNSDDGDVSGFHGVAGSDNYDIWIIKIDSLGTIEWQRCLGGTDYELNPKLTITEDVSYLINGFAASNNGDVSGNHSYPGFADGWLIKLSSEGELLWQQCFGSLDSEGLWDVYIISDTEMMLVTSTAHPSGSVECDLFAPGPPSDGDLWMFKIVDTVTVQLPENKMDHFNINVFPNPAHSFITFELPEQYRNCMLEIIDVYGKVLIKTKLNNPKEVIDVQTLKPGVYIYTLKAAGFSKWGKIVINKK